MRQYLMSIAAGPVSLTSSDGRGCFCPWTEEMPVPPEAPSSVQDFCRTCGACCAYDATWPRFSTESDEELARIPLALIASSQSGMRCVGERCSALLGDVGVAASCSIYAVRPIVCRACVMGDDECRTARAAHGLPPLPIGL